MAEGTFCHDFSAMSQCSRQPEEMQAGSHQHRKEYETMLERSCGYFAPDVSVAHFAPPCVQVFSPVFRFIAVNCTVTFLPAHRPCEGILWLRRQALAGM